MLTLYYSPGSCALASHIVLEEVGATYESIRVNFETTEQSKPNYLSINPKGRVPSLVTDRGVLTETPAILVYICQIFPAANLAPLCDPWALAKVQAFNSYLCSTVHVAHAHRGRGNRWASSEASFKDMRQKVSETVENCFDLIENTMISGPWVLGEQYSICDIYLYTIARWLEQDQVDINQFPKVTKHFNQISNRPAVKRTLEDHFG